MSSRGRKRDQDKRGCRGDSHSHGDGGWVPPTVVPCQGTYNTEAWRSAAEHAVGGNEAAWRSKAVEAASANGTNWNTAAWCAATVHPPASMVASGGAPSGTYLEFTITSQQDLNNAWNTIAQHPAATPYRFTFPPDISKETRELLTAQIGEHSTTDSKLRDPAEFSRFRGYWVRFSASRYNMNT